MKYQITRRDHRVEAIGAHSGYRIRLSTLASTVSGLHSWPVTVHVRGSESEPEIAVAVPAGHHPASATEALDFGYDCAVMYIDAMDHRLP